jgi:hypothetical protein
VTSQSKLNAGATVNVAEKERLRDTIARQIQRYLADGGGITVIEAPQSSHQRGTRSAWHGGLDVGPLFD